MDDKFSNKDDFALSRITKQIRKQNQDIVGEKCVKDDNNKLAYSDTAKKNAWKQNYQRLLNVEFPWDETSLFHTEPSIGPAPFVTANMVLSSIQKIKLGKSPGPSNVIVEMLKASPDQFSELIVDLINAIFKEGKIPEEWSNSYIVSFFNGKGSALDKGNYRGLKLADQVLKVVERVIEKIIRECIVTDDMQFGVMPGRGTTDAMFIVRQLQEKFVDKSKNLSFAFIDLEKAFDGVLWWAMRAVGEPESIVVFAQAMYNGAKSKVRVNGSYRDEFVVKVGVHQGSVLSPLLFIMVLDALSREFRTSCPWELFILMILC